MLTDAAIRAAKPRTCPYKLYDAYRLFLLVNPSGSKLWRFRYRFDGKEKLLALGRYPEVKLARARERRDDARRLLAGGVAPSEHRQREQAARAAERERREATFERVARHWHAQKHAREVSQKTARANLRRLEVHAFPRIGDMQVRDLSVADLSAVLREVASLPPGRPAPGGLIVARRLRVIFGQVLRYAVGIGLRDGDPTPALRGALPRGQDGHYAAVTEPGALGALLRQIDDHEGSPVVRAALRLAPLLAVRPGELRTMRWAALNLDDEAPEWRFTSRALPDPG